uniref:Putative conserved secreted protein n=1 Tax=Aedes albopictus TaxID=7160 RepID=A0A1W7R727_AEDAL
MEIKLQVFVLILVLYLSVSSPKCAAEEEDDDANTEPLTTTSFPIVATEEISDNTEDLDSTNIVVNPMDDVNPEASISAGSILIAPKKCPSGQKLDHRNICRPVSVF